MLFWLHGIARTKNGLTFVKGLETTWMKAGESVHCSGLALHLTLSGVLALTALTLTFIIGLRPIRRRFFEVRCLRLNWIEIDFRVVLPDFAHHHVGIRWFTYHSQATDQIL